MYQSHSVGVVPERISSENCQNIQVQNSDSFPTTDTNPSPHQQGCNHWAMDQKHLIEEKKISKHFWYSKLSIEPLGKLQKHLRGEWYVGREQHTSIQ